MAFGDFAPLCHSVPSYPWCNLFYYQLQHHLPTALTNASADPASAPVGIDPHCGIPRVDSDHSLANIANIIACGVSIFFVIALVFWTSKRRAAVGRAEFRIFLTLYIFTLILQLLTTGAFLTQGSRALVVLSALHAGTLAALFATLVGCGAVSTQVVEDGTMSSLVPFSILTIALFVATTYIALDVGFSFTSAFGPGDARLHSAPLFALTSVWPAAAAFFYFVLMLYVVLRMLNEVRPAWLFTLAAVLFVLAQLDYFLLSGVICRGTAQKVDGSFVATLLESAAVGMLFLAWRSITEESWDDDYYTR